MSAKENKLFVNTLKHWEEIHAVFKKEQVLEWADKKPETEDAQAVLVWAQAHPFLAVVATQVPESIVEGGDTFIMHDIRVTPPRVKKGKGGFGRIMDDEVYDLFEHARTYVPRGLTILEVQPKDKSKKPHFAIVVYAMKKFTGGPGDEDEEEDEEELAETDIVGGKAKWEYYFIGPHKSTKYIYNTTKENGDSAHLSFFNHQGHTYYLVGSKNVHMLIRNEQDVEKYTDGRFRIASLIGKHFVHTLEHVFSPEKKNEFINYMLKENFTATFEFLQVEHQHIELFDFPASKFRFIAFTFNDRLRELSYDLEKGSKAASAAGWETTIVVKHSFEEQDSLFNDIRFNTYGKEGSVLYYVNGEDRVIGMMKKKTIWYILVRAIREKLKALVSSVGSRLKKGVPIEKDKILAQFDEKLKATMEQKQSWLKLPDDTTQAWLSLASSFLAWNFPKALAADFDVQNLINTFPAVWNQFLQETNATDKI